MPPCCRTVRLARRNLATLAIVSAARHFRSLFWSRRILTIVCRPPRSAIARRIWVFREISFRIFREPIYDKENDSVIQLHIYHSQFHLKNNLNVLIVHLESRILFCLPIINLPLTRREWASVFYIFYKIYILVKNLSEYKHRPIEKWSA